jgi:penicillin-binding protein 1A
MTYRQRKSRRRKRRTGRSSVLLGLGVLATVAVIAALSAVGYVLAIAATAPDLSELKADDKGQLSVVYAADGSRLGFIQSDVLRRVIPWRRIPVDLRRATVAIEDERFYKHDGVDLNAIIRAGIKNLESGKTVQGGSTITQQLVRALYIRDPKRDYARKIREAKLASELEDKHSKTWILHNYLNSVPYGTVGGRTAIGVEAAAVTYFDKHVKDLTLAESALLAGLPQAPSQYNPFRNHGAAVARRNEVIRQMLSNRFITRADAAEAMEAKLKLKHGTRYITRREPYFFDFVQEQLIQRYGVGVVRRGGLRIHTMIDPAMQELARKAITGQLYEVSDPSGALVSIDPSNGYIRAMASSGTYQDRNFNLAAQGHRQPGSAFKTMVLTAAIRAGMDPDRTTYVSKPLNIVDEDRGVYTPWEVQTYSHSYSGTMTVSRATLASDNTVYAQMILDVGPKKVCQTAKLLGIRTKLDCYPAEGLGGLRLGVTPLEMANAYATLASGGMRNKPKAIKRVVFPDGKSEHLGKPERKRVITDGQAYEVTQILEQNVLGGTGTAAQVGCPVAGKTGTTDEFNDAWFVGYTPNLSTAVWVGYPDANISMEATRIGSVAGGTWPAMIWHDFMSTAKGDNCDDFALPTEPAEFSPFFGEYASTGSAGTGQFYGDSSPDDTGTDQEYDPRFYEEAPLDAPETPSEEVAPQPEEEPGPGVGNGNGNGNANGQQGGASPG